MVFVIQELLNNGKYTQMLEDCLKRKNIKYYLVSIESLTNPKAIFINPHDRTTYENQEEISNELFSEDKVFVYGGKAISNWAEKANLKPGTFATQRFNYSEIPLELRKELLNDKFEIGKITEISPKWDKFFFRPDGNNKIISGRVLSKYEFENIQSGMCESTEDFIACPLKTPDIEYRLFVIDGVVVTGSQYAQNGEAMHSTLVPKYVVEYVQKIIETYEPTQAYVLDIAETNGEMKIVEYNNINTSALYLSNVNKFVDAVCNMLKRDNQ